MRPRVLSAVLPVVVTLGPLGGAGCSAFGAATTPDEPSLTDAEGGALAPEAGSEGGEHGDAAGTEGVEAGAFMPIRDDFESGAVCTPWTPVRSVLQTTAGGADGSGMSCSTCAIDDRGGGAHRTVRPAAPATALPPGTYTFTLDLRSAAYAGDVVYELYELQPDGTRGTYFKTQKLTLSPTWTPVQISWFTSTAVSGWWLDLYEDGLPSGTTTLKNTCFQLDASRIDYAPP